jgi:anti-sigma factor RsiW
MVSSGGDREAEEWSEMGPHDEFLELCAVSTSGDLTEEERKKLRFHLAGCAECQQAFREFEAAIDVGIPFLSSKLSPALSEESELYQRDPAESMLVSAATPETEQKKAGVRTDEEKREFDFAHRSGHRRTQADWNLVWLPFAACIFLTIALGVYG